MKISKDERHTLRELAKRSMELASLPLQAERKARAKDINDLKRRRPIVWLNEIPWHEMDIDGKLVCVCEDAFARGIERHFRQTLYRWEYIQADTVVEGWYPIGKAYSSTGLGVEVKENIIPSDEKNHIVSHGYIDQLDSLEAVAKIKDPVIKADREQDAKHLEWAADILDGIMDAKLCGNYIYHAPWDTIPRLHGVENVMSDLIDRPELMHAAVRRFTEAGISQMRQMEAEGLLGNEKQDVHCTPAYSSETVPKPETKLKDIWFRGMAQMFSDVSPAMWDEFDLQYMKPL
ncbi:MAG: hypothetical protein FWF03_08520, partial [Defluviitaleaceae bacterium]|nr:hypothetical protein [Defluviitaleaceae bacterium]